VSTITADVVHDARVETLEELGADQGRSDLREIHDRTPLFGLRLGQRLR